MGGIRIMIVEDHPVVREGLAAMMRLREGFEVVASVASGERAVEVYREIRPDVVLMDLRMPGLGGVGAIRAIRAEFPDARVVVLTTYDGDEDIHRAIDAGAAGYLLKYAPTEELWEAIQTVHAGGTHFDGVAATISERDESRDLTAREYQVVELIVAGNSNKEIGKALGIAETTVKDHVTRILAKLGVEDRTQAATAALRRGIVT